MKLRSVYFISGHKLLDDGAGGYKLDCPESGDMGPGDPGMVVILTSRPESVCFGCGQAVGRLSFGSPQPYEVVDTPAAEICPGTTCEKGEQP